MTNQVSILEKKIEVLEEQVKSIKVQRWKCQERFQAALTRGFEKYFRGVVGEDVSIVCTNTTINFKMLDEDCREREIFQIYLRENYMIEEKSENAYRGVELSYYTTSTNSDFELQRLENLGRVAMFVRNFKEEILRQANELAKIYDAELAMEKFFERENEVEKQIRNFRNEIYTIKKKEKRAALFSEEGLSFEKESYIQLKANFTVRVKNIKLIEIAKSGKTATAVFTYFHGDHVSREERVSIEKVVAQVI
jgi:hypothetical protein